jgi:putative flippase GtrA
LSPRRSSEARTFARFCAVGGLGFAVDAGVLLVLTAGLGIGPIAARIASVAAAVTATWTVHRIYTFRSRDPGRFAEWRRFATVNGGGAAINFAVYWIVLALAPDVPPLLALASGSAVALGVNYLGSRVYAFRRASPSAANS